MGYYTAIMAEVVGPDGSVVACEVDSELAGPARGNLASYSNVTVYAGDGASFDPGACDAMLINAGVTHPHPPWLERLRVGGRLVLPLTVATAGTTVGNGVMAKIVRMQDGLSAGVVTFVGIYSCTSVRDQQLEPLLAKAIASRGAAKNEVGAPGHARANRHLPAARPRSMSELRCFSAELIPCIGNER